MQKRFQNKVVLITASATGIGLAMAERFASEGANVVISSRNQQHVDHAVDDIRKKGFQAIGMVCHAGKEEDLQKLVDYTVKLYGGIDVLVPNVAVSTFMGSFLDINKQQMQKMLDINILSTIRLIQLAVPHMLNRKHSNILIISSNSGYMLESKPIGFYAMTKTMLISLMKVLSRELHNDNIRVNAIAPGIIKTKFSEALWKGDEKGAEDMMGVKRLGKVEDISSSAAFLCSYEADYITGECLVVQGFTNPRL